MDNFKNIKDYHIGCNDVSDIVLNAIIDTYNWLEKQGKKEFTFKSIPRLLEMIEHTDRAKSYCQKLIDSLVKEGYTADAKIVEACLKQMNGENVAMAVMDKKPLIIIPKFRVGDEVVTKNEESLTITRIDEEGYWSNDLFICGFDDSDEWELVEQKPDNKIEPKFHEGDWVVWDNKISCHIDNIYQGKESLMYTITDTNNMIRSYSVKSFDNNAHLWSIEDAKDGDILVSQHNKPFIYNGNYNEYKVGAYCGIDTVEEFFIDARAEKCWTNNESINPATKEQRDMLFQKMHESGYEWNAEKKELKLLITNGGDFESENCEQKSATWGEEQGEQKPIDKIQLGKKYKCIASPRYSTFRRGNIYKPVDNFLCNLMNLCYECFEPIEDSEQKPSDNDMVEALRTEYEKGRADVIAEMQKEWSEEDESNLNGILDCYKSMDIKWRNWLKSIKDRVQPRSSWKPTKKQLYILNWVANIKLGDGVVDQDVSKHLNELYEDLKKL